MDDPVDKRAGVDLWIAVLEGMAPAGGVMGVVRRLVGDRRHVVTCGLSALALCAVTLPIALPTSLPVCLASPWQSGVSLPGGG